MSCEVQNYELVFLTDYQLPLHIIHLKIIMGIHPLANCRRHAAHHKILLQESVSFVSNLSCTSKNQRLSVALFPPSFSNLPKVIFPYLIFVYFPIFGFCHKDTKNQSIRTTNHIFRTTFIQSLRKSRQVPTVH